MVSFIILEAESEAIGKDSVSFNTSDEPNNETEASENSQNAAKSKDTDNHPEAMETSSTTSPEPAQQYQESKNTEKQKESEPEAPEDIAKQVYNTSLPPCLISWPRLLVSSAGHSSLSHQLAMPLVFSLYFVQIQSLQTHLESLKAEKHKLFQQLKMVLHEEDEKKRMKEMEQKK